MPAARRVAIIGAGWAGLAAAVASTQRGDRVTLFEMAPQAGGRAREVMWDGTALDNGQHILIGAYSETLRLMRVVGVNVEQSFLRTPLRIIYPEGAGLQLQAGTPALAFARAVLRYRGWSWRERLALLRAAGGWRLRGFKCDAARTVTELTAGLPAKVRAELIDPLCVAALNTPSGEASASVFLRVLKDALHSGPGSADLLLPRVSLSEAFPAPALRWLEHAGASLRLGQRVEQLSIYGGHRSVDGEPFDQVVLATPSGEAARLTQAIAPAWSRAAAALRYEPIVTVYLRSAGCVLPAPMLALHSDDDTLANAPAQFVFDRGQLGGSQGLLAFVISGAQAWVDAGAQVSLQATLTQAQSALSAHLRGPLQALKVLTEKRATFRCTPKLHRPASAIAPGLQAAGDYIAGPYPATLEGSVRSGIAAVTGM